MKPHPHLPPFKSCFYFHLLLLLEVQSHPTEPIQCCVATFCYHSDVAHPCAPSSTLVCHSVFLSLLKYVSTTASSILYAKSATMCPSAFLCLLPNTSSPLLPFPLISVPISPWRLSLPLHTTYSRIPCLWSTCTPNIFHITVLISNFKLLILADILLTPRHYSHTLPSRSPLLYFCYYLHCDRTAPVLLALLLFYLVSCLHYNINLPSLHHTYP